MHNRKNNKKNRENDIDKSITRAKSDGDRSIDKERQTHTACTHTCMYTHKSGLSVRLILYVYNDMT